jgi:hypothetical protein
MLVLAASHAAQAQEFSSVFSLSYGESKFSNTSLHLNENSLKGRIRAQMGNGLSFGLQFGAENTSAGAGTSGSVKGQNTGVDVLYTLQNGTTLGAFAENTRFGEKNATLVSSDAIGFMAGYAANGLSLKGFLGSATLQNAPLVDITAFGGTASYQVAQNLTLGANLSQHSISNNGKSNTVGTFGLGAVYHPTAVFGLHAGITSIDFGASGANMTEMGLGASYNVNAAGKGPILATIELVSNDYSASLNSYSFDTVRLGMTLPLGKAAKNVSVPINSAADRVFQPVRDVIGLTTQTSY